MSKEKEKGNRFERDMLKWALIHWPEAQRRMQAGITQALEPDVRTDTYAIECKNRKSLNIRSALRQAMKRCPGGHYPFVVARLQGFFKGAIGISGPMPLDVAIVPLETLDVLIREEGKK